MNLFILQVAFLHQMTLVESLRMAHTANAVQKDKPLSPYLYRPLKHNDIPAKINSRSYDPADYHAKGSFGLKRHSDLRPAITGKMIEPWMLAKANDKYQEFRARKHLGPALSGCMKCLKKWKESACKADGTLNERAIQKRYKHCHFVDFCKDRRHDRTFKGFCENAGEQAESVRKMAASRINRWLQEEEVTPNPDEDSSESIISGGTLDKHDEADENSNDEDEDDLEEIDDGEDDKDKEELQEIEDEPVEDSSESVISGGAIDKREGVDEHLTDEDEDELEEIDDDDKDDDELEETEGEPAEDSTTTTTTKDPTEKCLEKDGLVLKASCLCSLAKRNKQACHTMSNKVIQEFKPFMCKMAKRGRQKECKAKRRYLGLTRPTVSPSQIRPKPDEDSSESAISEGTIDKREEVDENLDDEDEDELEQIDDEDEDELEETEDEPVEDSSESVIDDDEDELDEVDEAATKDPAEKCLEKDSLATKASCLCSLAKQDKRACRTMSNKVNQAAKPWTCKMVRRRKQKKCAANMRY